MGIIVTNNEDVRALKGVHLYHHGMSQCSQRVRICLEEKSIAWVDHTVNLLKGEHLLESYGSINPNNVVPTLVHDGIVIIESTDIIAYIDEHFPGPSFTPTDAVERVKMEDWLAQSNALKRAIRVLSHEFLFKPVAKKSAAQLQTMKAHLSNQELVEFHSKFSCKSGLDPATITESICQFDAVFAQMDEALSKQTWLAGEMFSLADISWMGDIHRIGLMKFPMSQYPHLLDWVKRITRRASFKKGLLDYEPLYIRFFFRFYTALLTMRGKNVQQLAVPCTK
jgi:glutathione S-transferase